MDRKALKANAKASLKGCKTNPYIVTLLVIVALVVISVINQILSDNASALQSIVALVLSIITLAVSTGFTWWTLSIARKNDDTGEFKLAFAKIIPVFLTNLVTGIFVSIAMILLIIPGIIVALGLSMSFFCLRDNLEAGFWAAIKESWRIMKGHKWELFVLNLSFIPWILLTVITCMIAGIYTMPYISCTMAEFYNSIK